MCFEFSCIISSTVSCFFSFFKASGMLPRISFNQFSTDIEKAAKVNERASQIRPASIPVIPPRESLIMNNTLPPDVDEKPSWYMVLSPRETKGTAGPFSVPQLRQMYKHGDLTDKTLLWCEGEKDWQQLIHQKVLRPKLIQLPILPPRIGSYNHELAVFDPIMELPPPADMVKAVDLPDFELNKYCAKCGGIAVTHLPALGETEPDLFKLNTEVGTTTHASEILPGFLWIGNSGSSKKKSLLKLGITLLVNCAANMNNPNPNPPFYRCKDVPLMEKPEKPFTFEEQQELLLLLEKAYDYIELERLYPEHGLRSDPKVEWRGPTDKYGLPVKPDKPFRKLEEGQKAFPSRVLLWSRLGFDRACAVGAAYLIKHYGMKLERAMEIIRGNRPQVGISVGYLELLGLWAAKYAMGVLICLDCRAEGLQIDSSEDLPSSQLTHQQLLQLTNGSGSEVVDHKAKVTYDAKSGLVHITPSEERLTPYEENYKDFAHLMKSHLPTLIKDAHQIHSLCDTHEYLIKLLSGFNLSSPWTGLMDLELSGQQLSDQTVAVLFQLLHGNGIIRHLRMLNLQNNEICNMGMKAILMAYFPIDDMDDQDEYNLDDAKEQMLEHGGEEDHDLTLIDLARNKFDEYGVKYLCYFLKQCNSLTAVNVSDNNLPDYYCADIISCFERPPLDFLGGGGGGGFGGAIQYGDDDSIHSVEQRALHNHSVTHLNIGFNQLGPQAGEALRYMFRHNHVMTSINLELCVKMPPVNYKWMFKMIRVYNTVLREINLSNSVISVKAMGYIAQIMESDDNQIAVLNFSNCRLKHQHIEKCVVYFPMSKHLTRLNLSGNALTDKAAEHLAAICQGKRDVSGQQLPPLKYLDLSDTGLHYAGASLIMKELSLRSALQCLDLSSNDLPEEAEPRSLPDLNPANAISREQQAEKVKQKEAEFNLFWDSLAASRIYDLRLNSCNLKARGAMTLFNKLAESSNPAAQYMKTLFLSDNKILDSAAPALCNMLQKNCNLELMDLGFNEFTAGCTEMFKETVMVVSKSELSKKVFGLTINMIGNKCDPYVFETPGLSRSKTSLLFGLRSNAYDNLNRGFTHVSQRARGNFLVRKEMEDEYRRHFPLEPINSIP